MQSRQPEEHRTHRIGWLRAAVLGADDGVVSTASLLAGVAASHAATSYVLIAGLAGLVAGSMSMAAGEYVSVSSQRDTERADLERERRELDEEPEVELEELTDIYMNRGLERELAAQVAGRLMAHDALGAHARDELGISPELRARPLQAAIASAASFASGAAIPLATAALVSRALLLPAVVLVALVLLGSFGALAARIGGASIWVGTRRVLAWGSLAMALTAAVGTLFGVRG